MSNQDILSPVPLQLFPQIPEVPLQISEILNGEKIIASFEVPNTIKYISILNLCVVIMIFWVLFVNWTIVLPESSLEITMISIGVWSAFLSAFWSIVLFFHAVSCVITPTRLLRFSRWSVDITAFEEISPRGIIYGKFHILFPLKPKRYNDSLHMSKRHKILLLRAPMSYEVGRYIVDRVQQLQGEMDRNVQNFQ